MLTYYQAPQLCSVFAARMVWALYYISKSFSSAALKLEKISYDTKSETVKPYPKAGAENIDFKEVKQIDHITFSYETC